VLLIIHLVVVLGIGVFAFWSHRGSGKWARRVRPRSCTVIGAILVCWSFLLLPWLHLDVTRYLGLDSPLELASWEALAAGARRAAVQLGGEAVESAIPILGLLANPPGALLLVWRPNALSDLLLPAALLAAPAVALASLACMFTSLTRVKPGICMLLCMAQSGLALLGFVMLFLAIPTLDAWGTQGRFPDALIPLLTGSRLGAGVWVALGGLVLLFFGGAQIYDALIVEQPREAGILADALADRARRIQVCRPHWSMAVGSALVLASFLVLPWVQLEPQAFAGNLARVTNPVERMVGPACHALETVGVTTCTGTELDHVLFSTQDVQRVRQVVSSMPALTGMDLVALVPWLNPSLQLSLLVPVTVSAVCLAWSVVVLLAPKAARAALAIQAGCGLVSGLMLLPGVHYHSMLDTIGTQGDFAISLLSVLAQSRVSYGASLYLIGLLLMGIGGAQAVLGVTK